MLVDLADAVADEMSLPFESISLEMVERGLYHFQVAERQGLAADPVKYFALKRKSRFRDCQSSTKTQG